MRKNLAVVCFYGLSGEHQSKPTRKHLARSLSVELHSALASLRKSNTLIVACGDANAAPQPSDRCSGEFLGYDKQPDALTFDLNHEDYDLFDTMLDATPEPPYTYFKGKATEKT